MQFSVGQAFSQGWEVMKRHYGTLLGGAWVYVAIVLAMALVPLLGPLANLLIGGPLAAGWLYMGVRACRGKVEFNDLWAGFSRYGETLGTFWLVNLLAFGALVPVGVAALVGWGIDPDVEGPFVIAVVLGGIVSLVLLAVLSLRFTFALVLCVDRRDLGITDCLRASWGMTAGVVSGLFLLFLVVGLMSGVLMLPLYLPFVFLGMPYSVCIMGATYEMLARPSDVERLEQVYE